MKKIILIIVHIYNFILIISKINFRLNTLGRKMVILELQSL